jgi:hypothetical protein
MKSPSSLSLLEFVQQLFISARPLQRYQIRFLRSVLRWKKRNTSPLPSIMSGRGTLAGQSSSSRGKTNKGFGGSNAKAVSKCADSNGQKLEYGNDKEETSMNKYHGSVVPFKELGPLYATVADNKLRVLQRQVEVLQGENQALISDRSFIEERRLQVENLASEQYKLIKSLETLATEKDNLITALTAEKDALVAEKESLLTAQQAEKEMMKDEASHD